MLTAEGYRRGQPPPRGPQQAAQAGGSREGPLSPALGSAGHSTVGGTGVSRRAACGWAGGAREGCPWEVPHRGRRWQSASVCWEGPWGGALGPQGEAARSGGAFSEHRPGLLQCPAGALCWRCLTWCPVLGWGTSPWSQTGQDRGFGAQRSSLEGWKGCSQSQQENK